MILVNKVEKILKKLLTAMIIFQITFVPISNASAWDDIFNQGDAFINEGKYGHEEENGEWVGGQNVRDGEGNIKIDENGNPVTIIDQTQMQESIDTIYTVLLYIGIALSVIIGAILGIKFMLGTVEEQAKVKETLIPYALGCIVVFGAFGIWKFMMQLGGSIFN